MKLTQETQQRLRKMLLVLGILFIGMLGYKIFQKLMLHWYLAANAQGAITVSATKVSYQPWQPELEASANLRAVQGIDLKTEVAGIVQQIYVAPGAVVPAGTVLVQLNADVERAALQGLIANAELAKITYLRDRQQYAIQAISKQVLDADAAKLKNALAQVAQQQAVLMKKTIRAPFSGKIGIIQVALGSHLKAGDSITLLENLEHIYADCYVPQQVLGQLKVGQRANLKLDNMPQRLLTGKITTINPAVDQQSRNVLVEAVFENKEHILLPGMFANLHIITGPSYQQLTVPQSALDFKSYGAVVFLVKNAANPDTLTVKQAFVVTGATRGDQIAIVDGVAAGDTIVTSGQLKLNDGTKVIINNDIVPAATQHPQVPDDHSL